MIVKIAIIPALAVPKVMKCVQSLFHVLLAILVIMSSFSSIKRLPSLSPKGCPRISLAKSLRTAGRSAGNIIHPLIWANSCSMYIPLVASFDELTYSHVGAVIGLIIVGFSAVVGSGSILYHLLPT